MIVNAIPRFFISFKMASVQKVFPFFWSIHIACVIDVGISIPYLCEHFLTREDTADTMTSLFRKVYGTHQAKSGSSWIPRAVTYSATSTGFDSFKYLSLTHCLVPFFHLIWSAHPTVVLRCVRLPCFVLKYFPDIGTAVPSRLWSRIASRTFVCKPSGSTCANKFSAIIFC